jgi:hypothetical protein
MQSRQGKESHLCDEEPDEVKLLHVGGRVGEGGDVELILLGALRWGINGGGGGRMCDFLKAELLSPILKP